MGTWGTWEEGKCIFFDDSFTHEVENDSDSVRIVLLIRFWHPELNQADWMPTLQKGVEEYEKLALMRMMPEMTTMAKARLEEALGTQNKQDADAKSVSGPESILKMEADEMAVGVGT